jgi:hypothetical protein
MFYWARKVSIVYPVLKEMMAMRLYSMSKAKMVSFTLVKGTPKRIKNIVLIQQYLFNLPNRQPRTELFIKEV